MSVLSVRALVCLHASVQLRNVNVISVCGSVCAHVCVCLWPSAEAGCAGRQAEICIGSSAGDLFDLSTCNTSGGLPAENLGSYLISQGERHAQIGSEREGERAGTLRLKVEPGIVWETAAEKENKWGLTEDDKRGGRRDWQMGGERKKNTQKSDGGR